MPVVSDQRLCLLATHVFEAAGASAEVARLVAESLVEADLCGHDSHGVIRIAEYVGQIRAGQLNPRAVPEPIRETPSTLLVDGHWGFGQVTAKWTMERVLDLAARQSVAAGGICRCGHIGRIGVYPELAAARGFIALAFANGGGKEPRMAPFGGASPVFGTNPLAAAVPGGEGGPIVVDFSTAVVAAGKIRVLRDKGEPLPEGWILDRNGQPSRRPADYYDGGMLLPAAGHKGYGLALLVEVLGGLLTGAGAPGLPESGYQVGNGVFFLAFDVGAFRPPADFAAQVAALSGAIKGTPTIGDTGEVLLPGEPERREKARRLSEGISIADKTWQTILDVAGSLEVTV